MGSIWKLLINSLRHFPRLFEKFNLPQNDDMPQFHWVIERDVEFDKLKHMIYDEIIHNQQQIKAYVNVWAPFQSIWELDKDAFIEKFDKDKAPASVFDINITVYTETANQVVLQETVTTVYFINVNSVNLKNSILAHIESWNERHKQLLKTHAYEKISSKYLKHNLKIF